MPPKPKKADALMDVSGLFSPGMVNNLIDEWTDDDLVGALCVDMLGNGLDDRCEASRG